MGEMFWFTLFLVFCFVIPFKWWQASTQAEEQRQFYENKIRNIELTNQAFQNLAKEHHDDKKLLNAYMQMYTEKDGQLADIEEYIFDNNIDESEHGSAILNIIYGGDK